MSLGLLTKKNDKTKTGYPRGISAEELRQSHQPRQNCCSNPYRKTRLFGPGTVKTAACRARGVVNTFFLLFAFYWCDRPRRAYSDALRGSQRARFSRPEQTTNSTVCVVPMLAIIYMVTSVGEMGGRVLRGDRLYRMVSTSSSPTKRSRGFLFTYYVGSGIDLYYSGRNSALWALRTSATIIGVGSTIYLSKTHASMTGIFLYKRSY